MLLFMTRRPQQTDALVTWERAALMHVLEGHNGGEHERPRAAPKTTGSSSRCQAAKQNSLEKRKNLLILWPQRSCLLLSFTSPSNPYPPLLSLSAHHSPFSPLTHSPSIHPSIQVLPPIALPIILPTPHSTHPCVCPSVSPHSPVHPLNPLPPNHSAPI